MTANWYLVKYRTDIFRNEPRNIGIVVTLDGRGAARFIGEQNGNFDGRKIMSTVSSVDALRAWVNYIRAHLRKGTFDQVLESLGRRNLDNYQIEYRGVLRDSGDPARFQSIVNELFQELVATPDSARVTSLADIVNDLLFRKLRFPLGRQVERNVAYDVNLKGVSRRISFDYRYINGHITLMDRLSLLGHEKSIEQRINDLLFRIEHVPDQGSVDFLTFYDAGEGALTGRAESRLRTIERFSHTIDARSKDAIEEISVRLGGAIAG